MKERLIFFIGVIVALTVILFIASCSATSNVAVNRSGAQLWGENCVRCHNAPTPATFSDVEWGVAVSHMKMRANLTDLEAEKIAEFLKSVN